MAYKGYAARIEFDEMHTIWGHLSAELSIFSNDNLSHSKNCANKPINSLEVLI